MNLQLDFTPEDFPPVVVSAPLVVEGRWACAAARFHEANPHVYAACVKIARLIKARGYQQYGIGAIWEILRFKALETTGYPYKLNNNLRAYYARTIMTREPDLAGFFSTRAVGRVTQ